MELYMEKIARFSKLIYVLLKIAFIVCIIAGILEAMLWLWLTLNLNTEVLTIAGVEIEAPLLFKSGDFKVFLPMMWESGFDLTVRPVHIINFGDLLLTVLTIIGLRYALSVFNLLRENATPFRSDVVKSLRKLAIALLCIGALSGIIPLLSAGIVWVLSLIFSYGSELQNENDTTL